MHMLELVSDMIFKNSEAMIKNIDNPYNAEINIREIYQNIFQYSVEDPYYFESYGISYGNSIFGRSQLDNFYVIKKRNEADINKNNK